MHYLISKRVFSTAKLMAAILSAASECCTEGPFSNELGGFSSIYLFYSFICNYMGLKGPFSSYRTSF